MNYFRLFYLGNIIVCIQCVNKIIIYYSIHQFLHLLLTSFSVFAIAIFILYFVFSFQIEESIPTPKREVDKPFVMPIEDTFSISGRGTVATGAIEKGSIKVGDDIEIVGLAQTVRTTCTGKWKRNHHRISSFSFILLLNT